MHRFLGTHRFKLLFEALQKQSRDGVESTYSGYLPAFVALAIALLPALVQFVRTDSSLDILAITTGISTLMAIVYRISLHIPFRHATSEWRKNLSLVHTAFALGCIPAVIMFLATPELLQSVAEKTSSHVSSGETAPLFPIIRFIMIVSVWAAVTEEFIYRGLLLSVLRRTRLFRNSAQRNTFAVLVSSLAFGLTHFFTWGPGPAVAVTGLGIGLGLGYIASGERLSLLILYHTLFDILSLSVTLLSGLLTR